MNTVPTSSALPSVVGPAFPVMAMPKSVPIADKMPSNISMAVSSLTGVYLSSVVVETFSSCSLTERW